MLHTEEQTVSTSEVSRYFAAIILVLLAGLSLAMITYRGKFLFWKYPISDLGAIHTWQGGLNIPSLLFFDTAMTISGLLMLKIAFGLSPGISVKHQRLKQVLILACSGGFFLVIFPYDVFAYLHMAGGALVFGPMWGLALLFSLELRGRISRFTFFIYQLVLQGTILTYATLFFLGIPVEQGAQKVGVAGLMAVLWFATRYTKDESNTPANRRK